MSIDQIWIDKLSLLVQRDHFIREALMARGILEDAYHAEMEKVHLENAKKLKVMINQNGFPVLSNAGLEGVNLSWLIINHSISDPDFMKECLLEIRMAAAQGDYPKDLLAYLEDRVAYLEGQPQLYGTNFDWVEGELKPTKIEDLKLLDTRRLEYGLPPMAETLFKISQTPPPIDPEKKKEEFVLWLKKVGWRI